MSGPAEAPSGSSSAASSAESLESKAPGAPCASPGQGEQEARGQQAAWPDLSDEALLAWPAGPLARQLAGAHSRAQLQRIDRDTALRCLMAQRVASHSLPPCMALLPTLPLIVSGGALLSVLMEAKV